MNNVVIVNKEIKMTAILLCLMAVDIPRYNSENLAPTIKAIQENTRFARDDFTYTQERLKAVDQLKRTFEFIHPKFNPGRPGAYSQGIGILHNIYTDTWGPDPLTAIQVLATTLQQSGQQDQTRGVAAAADHFAVRSDLLVMFDDTKLTPAPAASYPVTPTVVRNFDIQGGAMEDILRQFARKPIIFVNPASDVRLGGGVQDGKLGSLEEALMRQTTLFNSMKTVGRAFSSGIPGVKSHIPEFGVIVSPDIRLLKSTDGRPVAEDVRFDVISAALYRTKDYQGQAAPNAPEDPTTFVINTYRKLGAIFAAAADLSDKAVIAGREKPVLVIPSIGTGAYKNPKPVIAQIMAGLIQSYSSKFSEIILYSRDDKEFNQLLTGFLKS